jgi:hypothetical protein
MRAPGAPQDRRMILATGCLGARALDGTAIRAALKATGLERVLLVAGGEAAPRELPGVPAAGVRCAWGDLEQGLAAVRVARAPRLVLELPESLELDSACREVFDCARRHEGLRLAVATPDKGPLAQPAAFSQMLAELASVRVGYWHRPSRAHLLGHGDAPWIDALGRRLVGMSLDDVADGQPGAPPGLGGLDFRVAAASDGAALEVALDVAPLPDVALLRLAREHLRQVGFR